MNAELYKAAMKTINNIRDYHEITNEVICDHVEDAAVVFDEAHDYRTNWECDVEEVITYIHRKHFN